MNRIPSEREDGTVVLVVDDDSHMLNSTAAMLVDRGYGVITVSSADQALAEMKKGSADIVLSDIRMPEMSGLELLRSVHKINADTPVILMTAYADMEVAVSAIQDGAFDFLMKPFKGGYLFHTVEKAEKQLKLTRLEKNYTSMLEKTVKKQTRELQDALYMVNKMSREIVYRLSAAAEYRDTDTGAHISRIGLYAGRIAEALGMPNDFCETITFASTLHDIGKIGIPDHILLKPGALTIEEFEIIKTHTTLGKKILGNSFHHMIQMAASIALTHHERWDGGGYPYGMAGEDIPIEGRIVMLCDQYDALRAKRPYKEPFSHEKACGIILNGDGRSRIEHFDPAVLQAFRNLLSDFAKIFDTRHEEAEIA